MKNLESNVKDKGYKNLLNIENKKTNRQFLNEFLKYKD